MTPDQLACDEFQFHKGTIKTQNPTAYRMSFTISIP